MSHFCEQSIKQRPKGQATKDNKELEASSIQVRHSHKVKNFWASMSPHLLILPSSPSHAIQTGKAPTFSRHVSTPVNQHRLSRMAWNEKEKAAFVVVRNLRHDFNLE